MSLNNLATSLSDRFNQQGVLSDLDEAIDLERAAFALCSPGHCDQSMYFNNLAASLNDRFKQRGVLSDLDEAIDLERAALAHHPPGHSDRSMSLNNLAVSLSQRFKQRGVLSDLDEAIDLYRAALALCPPGHSDRSMPLNNLGASLSHRFNQQGVPVSDLDEAIDLKQSALAHHPPGHCDQSMSLNNLDVSLSLDRFDQRSILSDLDEAIDLYRAALALCPPGHFHRSMCLSNLAVSLNHRFKQRGAQSDLDEAIDLKRAALALRPPGHSDRSMSLNNLAVSLNDRFKQQGALSDLDEAIDLQRTALALCPPGHSDRSMFLNNLAKSLQDRFQQQGVLPNLDEAFTLYAQLSQISHAVLHSDLHAIKSWTISAEQFNHSSTLTAYKTALRLLDDWQHVAGLSSSSHYFDVVSKATSSLAMDAFSCSLRCNAFKTAVELAEQGRAVFWSQLACFHTPLDEISASGDIGKTLAAEFKDVSFRLRSMLEVFSEGNISRIRQLTMQQDDVIARIRMLPAFSRFLLHPLFSDLQKAAEAGPVIIVNASQYSCDALIILSAQDPVHIPLDIERAEVSELSNQFQSLTKDAGTSDHRLERNTIVGVLRTLWERIVGPILNVLKVLIPRRSRIWWCPTAEFMLLPLHAAGPYKKQGHNLSHFYISSYTPTLAALIRARQQFPRDASIPHFVSIGQGNPNEGTPLLRVTDELCDVASRVAPFLPFTSLSDNDATVQQALHALNRHQWVHLACHGMPNRQKPFESLFAMRDGPLTITDIIRPRLQQPEFAFLSACHTTVGYESSPDEAIHLAAAMQFSGFRSVIGSMWSVDDEVAGRVVSAFYDEMFDGSGRLNCTRAAVALCWDLQVVRSRT